ncbi:hypothetical protein IQ736_004638 [Salmonella enterica]|uniref:hypothetical protein n=1 Tax=Salmonella enterica TaxID=28901 RepID=UPI0003590CC7|nr:hypothetical protein [Salmonella enterica]AGQ74980.1 hypothetical protein CFSAN002050_04190 [Salmonella enterica subsp. enterica serovar Cubana str. CFSAN002050]EEA4175164.1 hypothetical protein [Salmonella enterica]EEC3363584.1 hypothetical protein [Salmonella enterica]EGF7472087.1 hypothetical protein [Salmonella enterica subsp. enterica serovar Cubana]EGL3506524.1 hypothetical protein [Salmonella enterica]
MKERLKEQVFIFVFSTGGSYVNAHHATEVVITTTTGAQNAPLAMAQEKSVTNLKFH